jgi:RNA polymerase sigma-70 factor (ECF subfamily)
MSAGFSFRDELVAMLPALRAFARLLVHNRELADDVVQETVMKAWAAQASFEPGTNFRAWLFRILRNHYFTYVKREKRVVELDPAVAERTLVAGAAQEGKLHLADLERGLGTLPPEQREVLLLFGVNGLSYEEIASVTGTPIGTVRSRLSRGRSALQRYLDGPTAALGRGPDAEVAHAA